MSRNHNISRNDAIQLVVDKKALGVGYRIATFVGFEPQRVWEDGWFDLVDLDHNAREIDGKIEMELLFNQDYLGKVPEQLILKRIEAESQGQKKVVLKLKVLIDPEYVLMDGKRFWILEEEKSENT